MQTGIPSCPDLDAFYPQTLDVYSNSGSFPPSGSPRISGVTCQITGTFGEGSRARLTAGFGYTHIIVVDPTIAVQDWYTGNSSAPSQQDYLAMPSGSNTTWFNVVLSTVVNIPGLGKKKIILADRYNSGTPNEGF
jgi:hypothetical protein